MLVSIRIAQHFENFKHMRLTQPFVVFPAHSGKLAVQNGVSAQFCAKSIVGHIHHGGEFFGGIVHSENFWSGNERVFHEAFRFLIGEK